MSAKALPLYIGRRYVSLGSSRLLTSFISRLSIIGLAIGVAVLVTVMSVMNGFDRELREKILALLPHITVSTMQNYPLLSLQDWQPVMETLEEVPEITGAAPQVTLQGMLLGNGKSKGVAVSGVVPELEQAVSIIDSFTEGGSLADLQPGEFRLLIGSGLARNLDVQVGDTVNLVSTEMPVTLLGGFPRRKNFTVAGIFTVGSQLDSALVYVNLEDAQRLYRLGNGIHGLRIQVNNLFDVNRTGELIRPLLPVSSRLGYWTFDYGNIYENIQLSKTLVGLLLLLLVAVAAFNVVVSLVMIVRDKQGDIAILRTMGTSEKQIRRIFVVQGGLIGLLGTGTGLMLGVLFSLGITDAVAWIQEVSGVEFLSADVYPVNYLPAQLSLHDCVSVAFFSLLLCLLATLYPAYTAAKVNPADALRHE